MRKLFECSTDNIDVVGVFQVVCESRLCQQTFQIMLKIFPPTALCFVQLQDHLGPGGDDSRPWLANPKPLAVHY